MTTSEVEGLCHACQYAELLPHPRGGTPYLRCGLSEADSRFPRFPRLPVLACRGYAPVAKAEAS